MQDWVWVIQLVSALGVATAAFFAWRSSKVAQQSAKAANKSTDIANTTMLYHLIEDIRKEYRSPEMHHAVRTLRQFYEEPREKGTDFAEEYDKRRKKEEAWVDSLAKQDRIKAEESTLHYQRRLVSHFYQYVATLYVKHILPADIVFETWAESDLRIIPDIIVPIENKLRQVLHTSPLPPLNEKEPLLVLYRDSKDYEVQKLADC